VLNQAPPGSLENYRIEIVDGDTIRSGDAPESGNNAKCP
jgi:hypothetical protein